MKTPDFLTDRFERNIAGTLNCFDRIVLFGTFKPICHPKAMGFELFEAGFKLLDYEKEFANTLRLQITDHIQEVAESEGLPTSSYGDSINPSQT